ncbi:MAG: hypothetical protein AB4426_03375 [Xenococcaceae cyanobacterium]
MEILKIKQSVPRAQTTSSSTETPEEKLLPKPQIQAPPSQELLSQPQTQALPSQELLSQPANYYQGIGWLLGTVSKTEENKLQITLSDGNTFGLTGNKKVLRALHSEIENNPSQPMWIGCYPQYRLQEQVLYFKAFYFSSERPEDVQPGIFILRGLWQFIPQNRRPVFSIHRNQLRSSEEKFRSQHLPLIWKEEQPFRFNKDSDERPLFYQIEARLISRLGCFGWVRSLAEPTKAPKKLKKSFDGKADGDKWSVKVSNERSQEEFKEIKMTEARAEITLKFNTIPEVRTLPKSRVEFYLLAPNGVVFTVNIKGKAWRKAEASMKEFPEWVAMVGGKLGNPTSNGFEIEGAGLQVFEKKPKEPKQTEENSEAIAS